MAIQVVKARRFQFLGPINKARRYAACATTVYSFRDQNAEGQPIAEPYQIR
jgi:hypothetical protein